MIDPRLVFLARAALKVLLRQFGLRCVAIEESTDARHDEAAS